MKTPFLLAILTLAVACTPQDEAGRTDTPDAADATTTRSQEPADASPPDLAPAASRASATGVVEKVDPVAGTVTIAHEPVEALEWPAMTMPFEAPGVDLSSIKPGDRVTFELTAEGVITSITADPAAR